MSMSIGLRQWFPFVSPMLSDLTDGESNRICCGRCAVFRVRIHTNQALINHEENTQLRMLLRLVQEVN